MSFPSDFSDLDVELAQGIGLDLPELELNNSSKADMPEIYSSLDSDSARFVMAWVFDLGRSIESCARATKRTFGEIRWEIRKIRMNSKMRSLQGRATN